MDFRINGPFIDSLAKFKGMVGFVLPHKAQRLDLIEGIQTPSRAEHDLALGWDYIADLQSGQVTKTFMDDILPCAPIERSIIYHAPFFQPNREEDYRVARDFCANSSGVAS